MNKSQRMPRLAMPLTVLVRGSLGLTVSDNGTTWWAGCEGCLIRNVDAFGIQNTQGRIEQGRAPEF